MKPYTSVHLSLLAFCLAVPLTALPAEERTNDQKSFDKIRSMVGQWHGELPDGNDIVITYEEINGGAIIERYRATDPMWWNMSTAYHLNSDRIMMSHFCSWGNHPRMSAASRTPDTGRIDFDFIDIAYNEPDNGFMRDLVIEFVNDDRVKHHWTWSEDGVDTELTLILTRTSR